MNDTKMPELPVQSAWTWERREYTGEPRSPDDAWEREYATTVHPTDVADERDHRNVEPLYTADQMRDFAAAWCKVAVANYEAIHHPVPTAEGGEVTEAAILELVAGTYHYHHKMDEQAERVADAFNRCREMTMQNIRTYFATRRAMLATAPARGVGVGEEVAAEPVAWTSETSLRGMKDGDDCFIGIMGRSRTEYSCIPLYTTPLSPGVAFDDAMVERACMADWGEREWQAASENKRAAERIIMRSILTAALVQP